MTTPRRLPDIAATVGSVGPQAHVQERARRARSGRALRNDALLRASLEGLLADQGWDAISIAGLARAAGLTTRPVYDRYGDLAQVGADAWTQDLGPVFAERLGEVVEAAFSGDSPSAAKRLAEAYEWFMRPDSVGIGSLELLGAAFFDDMLLAALTTGPLEPVLRLCTASRQVPAVRAAGASYVVVIALGLLMQHRSALVALVDPSADAAQTVRALAHPAVPAKIDLKSVAMHPLSVHDDDPALANLFTATLEEVAEVGYAGATMTRIAARAGVSQGLIFGRFDTKLELFLAATRRRHTEAFLANERRWDRLVDQHGEAIAFALIWREHLRPQMRGPVAVALEQIRLAWHDPVMRRLEDESQAQLLADVAARHGKADRVRLTSEKHMDIARGSGLMLASRLLPSAWRLPIDAVISSLG